MSITFHTNGPYVEVMRNEPCLCAQAVHWEIWGQAMDGDFNPLVRAALADQAYDGCPCCKGSGIDIVPHIERPEVNLANENAFIILSALGLEPSPNGSISFPELRRAVIRAKNTDLSKFVREPEVQYAPVSSSEEDSNVVYLQSRMRIYDKGVDKEYITTTIDRIFDLIKSGGTVVTWS